MLTQSRPKKSLSRSSLSQSSLQINPLPDDDFETVEVQSPSDKKIEKHDEKKSFSYSESKITKDALGLDDPKAIGLDPTQVIRHANVEGNSVDQAKHIVRLFNHDVSSKDDIIETNPVYPRGEEVKPNEFFIAYQNNKVQIAIIDGGSRALAIKTFLDPTARYGVIKHPEEKRNYRRDESFSVKGKHVIHVPIGNYAKAWTVNKTPVILGEGTHVIHDPAFEFRHEFVKQNTPHIEHGNLHLVRVLPGFYTKVTDNGKAILLQPRDEPYAFNTPNFVLGETVSQSTNYVAHGNFHILRVPPGQLAKIVENNIPKLLAHKEDDSPHVIDSPNVKFDPNHDYVNATDNVISHQTMHYVRVPLGKVAKVTVDGVPKILMPTEENKPYEFLNTRNFQFNDFVNLIECNYISHGPHHVLRILDGQLALVQRDSKNEIWDKLPHTDKNSNYYVFTDENFKFVAFKAADDKVITHGPIKRIITGKDEVALFNKNGVLEVKKGYYYTNDPNESFTGFFDTSMQTLEFPSKKTMDKRLAEYKLADKMISSDKKASHDHRLDDKERLIYHVSSTNDNVEIGFVFIVTFCVPTPEEVKTALTQFKNMETIADHIEGVVTADMSTVIKCYTSADFLKSFQKNNSQDEKSEHHASASVEKQKNYQEEMAKQMKEHLAKYGIKFLGMRIEKSVILDDKLTETMSSQAQNVSETTVRMAMVEKEKALAKANAEKEKEVANIQQTQKNVSLVNEAKAKYDAAVYEAQAIERKAQAEARAIEIRAKAEARAIAIKGAAQNRLLKEQGELYKNPALLTAEIEKAKFKSLENVPMNVTFKEFFSMMNGSGLSLAGPRMFTPVPSAPAKQKKEKSKEHKEEASTALTVAKPS